MAAMRLSVWATEESPWCVAPAGFAQSHRKGHREIETGEAPEEGRIRRPGAGRKFLSVSDPRLVDALEQMIEGATRGDKELRCAGRAKARGRLQAAWQAKTPGQHAKVAQILHALGYSLKAIAKPKREPTSDRDAQFRHIAAAVKRALARGFP